MKRLFFVLIFIFLSTNYLHSQNMNKGFTMLETGKYKDAKTFFKKILKNYPKNKTAKLCFGRAIGLNGEAPKAKKIFIELLELYPNSFEIKLNYAESLLWNSEFKIAEEYYAKLVVEDSTSFAALLGYANTLSNLKKYNQAIEFIDKSLQVSKNNPNALVSKKYIFLGLANQELQNRNYDKSIEILLKNFELFPDDKDIYLNLANTYIIAKKYENAKNTYSAMSNIKELYFTAKNGLALVAHLQKKEKDALIISTNLLNKLKTTNKPNDIINTQQRYVQALIWNKKFKQATNHIESLSTKYGSENWFLGLKATLYTYTGDFDNTIKIYDQILKTDPKSFDGNLGKANALKANNKIKEAYYGAKKALTIFPKQKDIENFITQIDQGLIPVLDSKNSYNFDNGKSEAYSSKNNISIPINTKTTIKAKYNHRNAFNNVTNNNSTSNLLGVGASYQLKPKINISTIVGYDKVRGNLKNYEQFAFEALVKTTPFKRQNLDIGYKRELQNFNAELLNRNIIQNNFYFNYNINTTFNLGWFTQYFYTHQSDQNKRNLLFTSLYYNLLSSPALKVGINYQYLGFKDQLPTIYFSPSKFNAVEIFTNLIKDKAITKKGKLYYGMTAAIGYQYIEEEDKKKTYRIQTNLGYKFNSRLYLEGYFLKSNIASAASDVFTYTEFGIQLKWLFLQKPIFKM